MLKNNRLIFKNIVIVACLTLSIGCFSYFYYDSTPHNMQNLIAWFLYILTNDSAWTLIIPLLFLFFITVNNPNNNNQFDLIRYPNRQSLFFRDLKKIFKDITLFALITIVIIILFSLNHLAIPLTWQTSHLTNFMEQVIGYSAETAINPIGQVQIGLLLWYTFLSALCLSYHWLKLLTKHKSAGFFFGILIISLNKLLFINIGGEMPATHFLPLNHYIIYGSNINNSFMPTSNNIIYWSVLLIILLVGFYQSYQYKGLGD